MESTLTKESQMVMIGRKRCPKCGSYYQEPITNQDADPKKEICGGCKSGDLLHKALTYKRNPPVKMRIIGTEDMGDGIIWTQLEEVEKPGPNPFMDEYFKRTTLCAACGKPYEEHEEDDSLNMFIEDYRKLFLRKCYKKYYGKEYKEIRFGARSA